MKMDKKTVDRSKKMLDALFEGNINPSLAERIRVWFKGKAHTEEKYTALKEEWDKQITENRNPSKRLIKEYNEMARLLGFPESEYIRGMKTAANMPLRRYFIRVAAVLLPFLMITGAAYLWVNRATNATQQIPVAEVTVTAGGDRQTVALPDGSTVTLYPGSELTYPERFTSDRHVDLTGKAYFQVTKDEERKFSVTADGLAVTVHGTEFMVTAFDGADYSCITLHNGSVEVKAGQHTHILKPLEKLEYFNSTGIVNIIATELEDFTKPNMDFNMRTLDEILTSIEIFYGVVVEGRENADMAVRYTIDLTGINDVGHTMSKLSGVVRTFAHNIGNDTIRIKTLKQ